MIYDYDLKGRKDTVIKTKDLKGKVLLIVNTATGCGFTPQYKGLEDLYEKYHEQGLEILDFPCNQFGNQAPGTTEEIQEVCRSKWLVPYQIFDKIEVNGENEAPLYKYLKAEQPFTGLTGKGAGKLKIALKAMRMKYEENDMKNYQKFELKKNDDNPLIWHVSFEGAEKTLYEKEKFKVKIEFSNEYVRIYLHIITFYLI